MNRYYKPTADNTPSEDTDGFDIDVFPIESITEPLRPIKGTAKAMTNASLVANEYNDNINPRFYMASPDDKYKYWISPHRSDNDGNITDCQPHIIYDAVVPTNKIVIKLENSWATPVDWYIDVTDSADPSEADWSRASSAPVVRPDGQVFLYWNGSSWSSNAPEDTGATTTIRGIRVTVNQLGAGQKKDGSTTTYLEWNEGYDLNADTYSEVDTDGSNSHFSLIEISARLEKDFTDRLTSVSDTFDAGEVSHLTPMGSVTSNVGNITLWNGDGDLDRDNEESIFAALMEPNAEVNLEYIYHLDGEEYSVQQFKMYVAAWNPQNNGLMSVELEDYSKYLKESKVPAMMLEHLNLREIVYRICDAVGFSDYRVENTPEEDDFIIPVWYTDGDATVWEVLDELSTATQSLVYFDHNGTLNVLPRNAGYNPDRLDWTLHAVRRGNILPDISSLEKTGQYEANVVKVSYDNVRWSEWNNGNPALEVMWEPEGTVALRAAGIIQTIPKEDANYIWISPKDAKVWQFEGLVNIEGELIRYDARELAYFTGPKAEEKHYVWVSSQEEQDKYHRKTPFEFAHKNYVTGKLRIKERGVWNTHVREHKSTPKPYTFRRLVDGHTINSQRGFSHSMSGSSITMDSAGVLGGPTHLMLMTTGGGQQIGDYRWYGTRIRFEEGSAYKDQIAGIVFHNHGAAENGYYVQLTPTNKLSRADRKKYQEITFYSRKTSNNVTVNKNTKKDIGCKPLDLGTKDDIREHGGGFLAGARKGTDTTKDGRQAVVPIMEYDVDVCISEKPNSGRHHVQVWVNGKRKVDTLVETNDLHAFNSKFGIYIKGRTKATFDYLYAIRNHANLVEPLDDMSFFDRVRGGYYGTVVRNEIPYEHSTQNLKPGKKSKKRSNNKPDYYLDEFGPQLHELREFDVDFENGPVQHSRVYLTNDWSSVLLHYRSTPFNAKFVVANASRENAIINGSETLGMNGGEQEVEHRLNVIGRPLVRDEEPQEHEVRNESQIRARGEIETTIDSDWIQTEEAAHIVGKWITDHWGRGQDEMSVSVFGNPLFEVGDVVAVDDPKNNLRPEDARYFITSIGTQFNSGISTEMTLRRVNLNPVI